MATKEKTKIFGLISMLIASFSFVLLVLFFLANLNLIAAIMGTVFFVSQMSISPIYKVDKGWITIYYLSPFKRQIKIKADTITKVIFDIEYKYSSITFSTEPSDVSTEIRLPLFPFKKLYAHLLSTGLNVESKGLGAIKWNP